MEWGKRSWCDSKEQTFPAAVYWQRWSTAPGAHTAARAVTCWHSLLQPLLAGFCETACFVMLAKRAALATQAPPLVLVFVDTAD